MERCYCALLVDCDWHAEPCQPVLTPRLIYFKWLGPTFKSHFCSEMFMRDAWSWLNITDCRTILRWFVSYIISANYKLCSSFIKLLRQARKPLTLGTLINYPHDKTIVNFDGMYPFIKSSENNNQEVLLHLHQWLLEGGGRCNKGINDKYVTNLLKKTRRPKAWGSLLRAELWVPCSVMVARWCWVVVEGLVVFSMGSRALQ